MLTETLSGILLNIDAVIRAALIPLVAIGVVAHIYTAARKRGTGPGK